MLASLINLKDNLIEPTFVSIAAHNHEFGDKILAKFLNIERNKKHAKLVGDLILCADAKIVDRLNKLN